MIRVFEDFDQLSRSAADLFADQARRAVAARGRFCVALAGGSTPRRTYELLSRPPSRDQVPWAEVHIFWTDERCVAEDDPRNNAGMARKALLERVPLPSGQCHSMACAGDPEAAARRYETLLLDFFAPDPPCFDLILLGLGEDGHTASLIPGTPAPRENDRLALPLQAPGDSFARLSLTVPVINQARCLAFLVSGEKKSAILHQVLEGPPGRFPAQLINSEGKDLRWLVDKQAAESLNSKTGLLPGSQ